LDFNEQQININSITKFKELMSEKRKLYDDFEYFKNEDGD
jgi:hypothetical protein